MIVKDAMNSKVIVAHKDISIKEAARIMSKYNIGSLIIVDEKEVEKNKKVTENIKKVTIIGVITESDIIRKIVATGLDPASKLVKETMSKDVITIEDDEDLGEACRVMTENDIKRLPVVDKGKLVGILTATDIISVEPELIEELGKIMLFSDRQRMAG